jgi:hypothetical protein
MSRFVRRLAIAAVLLTVVPTALAQSEPERPEIAAFRQGTHAFRRVVYEVLQEKPEVLTETAQLDEDPARTLFIVLGDPTPLAGLRLGQFVERGGAVLVATDRSIPSRTLSRDFGVTVSGERVSRLVGQDSDFYRALVDCPFVQPAARTTANVPLFLNLPQGVATNCPSRLWFVRREQTLPVLATFPGGCRVDDQKRVFTVPVLPFAVGGDWGDGRILVLSDHSVFINDMVVQPDNDNFDFAYNCVEWLAAYGRRQRVLFFDNGVPQTEFNIPLRPPPPIPLPPADAILAAANQALAGMQQENVFNRVLYNQQQRVNPDAVIRLLLLLLTAGLAVYGLVRLHRGWQRPEPGTRLLDVALPLPATGTVLEQRRHALARQGNLWEPARALARQTFAALLGPAASARPPAVRAPGGWWSRWTAARRVRRLWRLAYDPRPVPVSPRRFGRLQAELAELQAAAADGTIQFGK